MPLTPEDVVNKRFQPTKFREGYDQDEVDDFLDEIVVEFRRINQENEDLRQRLLASEARLAELQRGAAGMLHKVPAFFVPEVAPDVGVNRLACLVPARERCRQRAFRGQANRPVQRHPEHQSRMQEVMLLATHFPDTHVFAVPDITDLIREFDRVFPAVVGNGFAVFVDQINRVHQLAVDVQLDLVERLMGRKPEARFQFIQDNARFVVDELDV